MHKTASLYLPTDNFAALREPLHTEWFSLAPVSIRTSGPTTTTAPTLQYAKMSSSGADGDQEIDYGDAAEYADAPGAGSAASPADGEAAGAEEHDISGGAGGEAGEDVDADLAEMQRMMAQLEEDNTKLQTGATAVVEAAASTVAAKAEEEKDKREKDERSVFVAGVDFNTTAEELGNEFGSCGVVERVTILTDRTGRPKG